jgi:hypothetical protein
MRSLGLTRYALMIATASALLVGCGGSQSQVISPGALESRSIATHAGRRASWMLPQAKSTKRLLYLSDSGADVFVYDYDNFEQVGTLTGLDAATGECVDAKGDVWIMEQADGDEGGGNAVEYAHGGTSVLSEVTTDQPPGGCSVSPSGDLEITDGGILSASGIVGPSEVQVWKNASGTPTDYGEIPNCYYLSSGGYDSKGNLYVTGTAENQDSTGICELPAGGTALVPVKAGKAITDPVGIMWDGKFMAVTDVYYSSGDNYATTIFQTEEWRNGKALRVVGSTLLADDCFGGEVYVSPPPFIIGKKNTPVNTAQGTGVAGFNFICGINPTHFRLWDYPAGGNPVRETTVPSGGGEAVSIAP